MHQPFHPHLFSSDPGRQYGGLNRYCDPSCCEQRQVHNQPCEQSFNQWNWTQHHPQLLCGAHWTASAPESRGQWGGSDGWSWPLSQPGSCPQWREGFCDRWNRTDFGSGRNANHYYNYQEQIDSCLSWSRQEHVFDYGVVQCARNWQQKVQRSGRVVLDTGPRRPAPMLDTPLATDDGRGPPPSSKLPGKVVDNDRAPTCDRQKTPFEVSSKISMFHMKNISTNAVRRFQSNSVEEPSVKRLRSRWDVKPIKPTPKISERCKSDVNQTVSSRLSEKVLEKRRGGETVNFPQPQVVSENAASVSREALKISERKKTIEVDIRKLHHSEKIVISQQPQDLIENGARNQKDNQKYKIIKESDKIKEKGKDLKSQAKVSPTANVDQVHSNSIDKSKKQVNPDAQGVVTEPHPRANNEVTSSILQAFSEVTAEKESGNVNCLLRTISNSDARSNVSPPPEPFCRNAVEHPSESILSKKQPTTILKDVDIIQNNIETLRKRNKAAFENSSPEKTITKNIPVLDLQTVSAHVVTLKPSSVKSHTWPMENSPKQRDSDHTQVPQSCRKPHSRARNKHCFVEKEQDDKATTKVDVSGPICGSKSSSPISSQTADSKSYRPGMLGMSLEINATSGACETYSTIAETKSNSVKQTNPKVTTPVHLKEKGVANPVTSIEKPNFHGNSSSSQQCMESVPPSVQSKSFVGSGYHKEEWVPSNCKQAQETALNPKFNASFRIPKRSMTLPNPLTMSSVPSISKISPQTWLQRSTISKTIPIRSALSTSVVPPKIDVVEKLLLCRESSEWRVDKSLSGKILPDTADTSISKKTHKNNNSTISAKESSNHDVLDILEGRMEINLLHEIRAAQFGIRNQAAKKAAVEEKSPAISTLAAKKGATELRTKATRTHNKKERETKTTVKQSSIDSKANHKVSHHKKDLKSVKSKMAVEASSAKKTKSQALLQVKDPKTSKSISYSMRCETDFKTKSRTSLKGKEQNFATQVGVSSDNFETCTSTSKNKKGFQTNTITATDLRNEDKVRPKSIEQKSKSRKQDVKQGFRSRAATPKKHKKKRRYSDDSYDWTPRGRSRSRGGSEASPSHSCGVASRTRSRTRSPFSGKNVNVVGFSGRYSSDSESEEENAEPCTSWSKSNIQDWVDQSASSLLSPVRETESLIKDHIKKKAIFVAQNDTYISIDSLVSPGENSLKSLSPTMPFLTPVQDENTPVHRKAMPNLEAGSPVHQLGDKGPNQQVPLEETSSPKIMPIPSPCSSVVVCPLPQIENCLSSQKEIVCPLPQIENRLSSQKEIVGPLPQIENCLSSQKEILEVVRNASSDDVIIEVPAENTVDFEIIDLDCEGPLDFNLPFKDLWSRVPPAVKCKLVKAEDLILLSSNSIQRFIHEFNQAEKIQTKSIRDEQFIKLKRGFCSEFKKIWKETQSALHCLSENLPSRDVFIILRKKLATVDNLSDVQCMVDDMEHLHNFLNSRVDRFSRNCGMPVTLAANLYCMHALKGDSVASSNELNPDATPSKEASQIVTANSPLLPRVQVNTVHGITALEGHNTVHSSTHYATSAKALKESSIVRRASDSLEEMPKRTPSRDSGILGDTSPQQDERIEKQSDLELSQEYAIKCTRCNDIATLKCSACTDIFYCSTKCQVAHWYEGHSTKCHSSYSR